MFGLHPEIFDQQVEVALEHHQRRTEFVIRQRQKLLLHTA